MALSQDDARKLIDRRHPEWRENECDWRWLLDSYEGGERYRNATYGRDSHGYPLHNLIRHKREYPSPRETVRESAVYLNGIAQGMAGATRDAQANLIHDDDFQLRRARTPVPTLVAEVVDTYTSKIFSDEVDREAPEGAQFDLLREWWKDVDGCGTTIDDWMEHVVGPLVLLFGQIDLAFDHPAAPTGEPIANDLQADKAGLKGCVASYILPENMLDWDLNSRGEYTECLVLEYYESGKEKRYRHWTPEGWALYDIEGKTLGEGKYPYGRIPIRRIFHRKNLRCCNIGKSWIEPLADIQHEMYNRDSELILSDTIQAHPLLQGPDDYCTADDTMPIGPGYLLPKKKNATGTSVSYEGFEVIDYPKGAAESIRENLRGLRETADRYAKLMKPAGASGTGQGTVGQSGISKQFDHEGLHSSLSQVAKLFARVETTSAVDMALVVLFDGKPPADAKEKVKIAYPTVFNLYAADELATITTEFQGILAASGGAPETETMLLCEIVHKALPGRDDETYGVVDEEIAEAVQAKAKALDQATEAGMLSIQGKPVDPNAEPDPAKQAVDEPADDSSSLEAV